MFLQLSHIPHFTTLQKFTERISGTLLEKIIISSFIILTKNWATIHWNRFIWIQSNSCFTVLYRKSKLTRRKYIKISLKAAVLQQIICTIKIRRAAPTIHDDTIDFRPLIIKISELVSLSVVTADKAYDSEDNHVLVRDVFHTLSVIPARYEHVPIRKTHGRYRKQMKRGYCKLLYNQRNKNETYFQ